MFTNLLGSPLSEELYTSKATTNVYQERTWNTTNISHGLGIHQTFPQNKNDVAMIFGKRRPVIQDRSGLNVLGYLAHVVPGALLRIP